MFEDLNPEQRGAVDHGDGPLLVLAGAGTGKTATLAARVARLLLDGAVPERVFLLTFSRRAAAEMLTRAGRIGDPGLAARVVGGTFHAVGQRLLRQHGHIIGLDPGFSVIDAGDATDLMGYVRHDLGLDRATGTRFPRKETLVSILSQVANSQVKLSDVVAHAFPWCTDDLDGIRAVFGAYTARKREQQMCDFDDLLLLVRALGTTDLGSRVLGGLVDHVLVDEYQDVNGLQVDFIDALRPAGAGVTVVGDDAQAIFGFRAATTAAIWEFPDRYPGAEVVRLEHNYRSTMPILAVANEVMASSGFTKTLWSERAGLRRPLLRTCFDEATQAEAVCDSVLAHREDGVTLRSQAVLFRAGHHASLLELALGRRRIPYVKYGGLRFVEAAHVKDLLALLRLLDNPWDELAWFRVLCLLEGVGATTARRVMADLGIGGPADPGAVSPVARLLAAAPTVPPAARPELTDLRATFSDCAALVGGGGGGDEGDRRGGGVAGALVDRIRLWLEPVVMRRYDAPVARCGDLERLATQAAAAPTLRGFVAELVLDPPVSTGDLAGPPTLDDDWLILSTVHSAKGGEWDVVHVIHAADGMFPSDLATGDAAALAEERRLFYVAVTRARDVLEISVPLRYHHHRQRLDDRHGYAPISRFLNAEVQALMDSTHVGPSTVDPLVDPVLAAEVARSGVARVDAMLADLWS